MEDIRDMRKYAGGTVEELEASTYDNKGVTRGSARGPPEFDFHVDCTRALDVIRI